MSHILKELSKRNTHIPHIALFDEDKWHKRCSNAYFGVVRGGGHFWRVTQENMPIEKEISNMLDLGRKPFQWSLYIKISKNRKG